jgi:segregation and condensation protein B
VDKEQLTSIIEGLIFAHSEPLGLESLVRVIGSVSPDAVQQVLDELEEHYRERARGFMLARVAGGYQFRSLPTIAPWVLEMKRVKPARLSKAALETLSIIAYNQPVTRSHIEQIRGVESSAMVRNLMERELVTVVGKKDVPGRPLLYGTSKRFLEVFGLPDLASLPSLPQLEELTQEDLTREDKSEEPAP